MLIKGGHVFHIQSCLHNFLCFCIAKSSFSIKVLHTHLVCRLWTPSWNARLYPTFSVDNEISRFHCALNGLDVFGMIVHVS